MFFSCGVGLGRVWGTVDMWSVTLVAVPGPAQRRPAMEPNLFEMCGFLTPVPKDFHMDALVACYRALQCVCDT